MKKFNVFICGAMCLMASACVVSAGAAEPVAGAASPSVPTVLSGPQSASDESDSASWGTPKSAKARIQGTQPDSKVTGTVDFIETGGGVQVVASLSNVAPSGKHGFHVHQNGDCGDGGKAAAGHFNPKNVHHGFLPRDGQTKAHAGDMGNIEINDEGKGSLVVFLPGISLSEDGQNIAGKAVIVHAAEDDFSQPAGNAGERIGCGVIKLNQ